MIIAVPVFASAEVGGEITRLGACKNDSIVAYFPFSPSWSDSSYLFFIAKPDVQITSFEATINGESKAVQYKKIGSFLRAKVVVEKTNNTVSATFNVGKVGGCNTPVSYVFNRA